VWTVWTVAFGVAPQTEVEATVEADPPPVASPRSAGLRAVIVRTPEARMAALGEALRVRVEGIEILPFEGASYAKVEGEPYGVLEILPRADGSGTELRLVLWDGRAFERSVPTDAEHDDRAVATTVANLLVAIEEERLLPDRTQVSVPRPEPRPEPEPEPAPEPEPRPEPEPAPAPDPEPTPTPSPAPRSRVDLSAALRVDPVFGLSPRPVPGPTAVGGTLALAVRLPSALYVEGGARVVTAAARGYRLLRARGHVVVGYAYRRRVLVLGAAAGPSGEGWGVRDSGGRASSTGPDGARRPGLVGIVAQSYVGVLLPARPEAAVRVRLAARFELAASALPSGAAARVLDAATLSAPLFVAGGVESSVGVELGLWWRPPRRQSSQGPFTKAPRCGSKAPFASPETVACRLLLALNQAQALD
jgi:hypothetical protein